MGYRTFMTSPETSCFALLSGHRSATDTTFKSQNLFISNPCLKKHYYVLETSLVAMEMDLTKSIVLHILNFQSKHCPTEAKC